MTKQEQFNKAVSGVITQGAPAINPGSSLCRYRGPNGTKCALGQLIPDELYEKNMEGRGAYGILEDWPSIAALKLDKQLVSNLQGAHDFAANLGKVSNNEFLADFIRRARDIAAAHGLTTEVLENNA